MNTRECRSTTFEERIDLAQQFRVRNVMRYALLPRRFDGWGFVRLELFIMRTIRAAHVRQVTDRRDVEGR